MLTVVGVTRVVIATPIADCSGHLRSMLARVRKSAIAGCAVLWGASAAAQNLSPDPTPFIHVCAAQDGVLRLIANAGACSAGQKSLYLRTADSLSLGSGPTDPQKPSADTEGVYKQRIAALEARVKDLENAANHGELGNRVVAPFEVVDRAGKRILRIEEGMLALFNTSGKATARIVANDMGGYFIGESATEADLQASIGAAGENAGVRVLEGSMARLDLGRTTNGHYGLRIRDKKQTVIAYIGESKVNTGLAFVTDTPDKVKAALLMSEQRSGRVVIENNSGRVVAELAEGANKGGRLQIWSSRGEPSTPMVQAGVTAEGFGVVRAGPESFKPGFGVLGLPGSYISGKQN